VAFVEDIVQIERIVQRATGAGVVSAEEGVGMLTVGRSLGRGEWKLMFFRASNSFVAMNELDINRCPDERSPFRAGWLSNSVEGLKRNSLWPLKVCKRGFKRLGIG
jgi:hypothetical protein